MMPQFLTAQVLGLCAIAPTPGCSTFSLLAMTRLHGLDTQGAKFACNSCHLREQCVPAGLSVNDLASVHNLLGTRRRVKRNTTLFCHGDKFTSVYAIRTGFFKTCVTSEDGRHQVTGFPMAGEMIGFDGIVNDSYACDAVALEDAEVCDMPLDRIVALSRGIKVLQRHMHKIMSREIVREHDVMLMLGGTRALERLAAFLLNLVYRLHARGFSNSELILRMSREEIGSYLGLKLETVSRTFSRLEAASIVSVQQRNIHILDATA
jgi:CRP/FNR family transcriptional regulator